MFQQRPKRVISKPSRFMTTSSDEAPPKLKRVATSTSAGEKHVQDDIQDIRRTLEKDLVYFNNADNNYSHNNKNYSQFSSFDTYNQPQANIIQTHAEIHSNTNFQSSGQQDTHINNETHTHTQSYINLEPRSLSHNTHVSQTAQSLTQNYNTQGNERASYSNNVITNVQDHSGNFEARGNVLSENWNANIGESTARQHGHQYHLTQSEKSDIG